MSKRLVNLKPLEKEIMEKANFLYLCKYNGKEHLRTCIREAITELTNLNEVQLCKVFDIFTKDIDVPEFDFEEYVEVIYKKMQELGAE